MGAASVVEERVQRRLDRVHEQHQEARLRFWVVQVVFGVEILSTLMIIDKHLINVRKVDEIDDGVEHSLVGCDRAGHAGPVSDTRCQIQV